MRHPVRELQVYLLSAAARHAVFSHSNPPLFSSLRLSVISLHCNLEREIESTAVLQGLLYVEMLFGNSYCEGSYMVNVV